MDLGKVSKGLYFAGIALIVIVFIVGLVGISQGGRSRDFYYFLIPGGLLEVAGYFVGAAARKQQKERATRELKRKRGE